jgi:hypothetical protein
VPLSSISLILFVASGFIFVSRWKYSENASLAEGGDGAGWLLPE